MNSWPVAGGRLASKTAALSLPISQAAEAATLPFAVSLLMFAGAAQGGFYRPQASFIAVGMIAAALSTRRLNVDPYFIFGVGALALGSLLSWAVSGAGPNAWQFGTGLATAGASVIVAGDLVRAGDRSRLLDQFGWLGAGASLIGIFGVATHSYPWAMPAGNLWRTSSTLTYANAAGCLFLLTLGGLLVTLRERDTTSRRLLAFLTIVGLTTSVSRGAFLGGLVGLAILLTTGNRRTLQLLARPAAGAIIATAGLLPSIAGPPQPVPALAGIVIGAAVVVRRRGNPGIRRRRFLIVGIAVICAISGLIISTDAASRVFERRALPTTDTRIRTWVNTWKIAVERPVFGRGPGTFSIIEEDDKVGPVLTRYTHNEYLQALFETGVVGVASVLAAIVAFAAWMLRSKRPDPAWGIASAACAAFVVHSSFDFIWRFPLLIAIAFFWLGIAVTPPRVGERGDSESWGT